jgi:alkanesulfonate monooxygenase SsuD/methylene tetrahydromethanopterin reductase-like flavin-dependent oxidoreductase (luciferase family)
VMEAYKKEIPNAEPVGAFVNDNIMVTSTAFVDEDREVAYQSALNSSLAYLQSNVFRYHDTFPHPEQVPYWPDLIPDYDTDVIEGLIQIGGLICGDPDEALEQCLRWESAGADQLVFGSGMASLDEELETIRLLGEHVIPKIDKDPIHRTSRFRDAAAG